MQLLHARNAAAMHLAIDGDRAAGTVRLRIVDPGGGVVGVGNGVAPSGARRKSHNNIKYQSNDNFPICRNRHCIVLRYAIHN